MLRVRVYMETTYPNLVLVSHNHTVIRTTRDHAYIRIYSRHDLDKRLCQLVRAFATKWWGLVLTKRRTMDCLF